MMEGRRKPHPFAMFSAWFLVVFLVLFPKGGIKAGGIPLTWGYMYLALTTPLFLLVRTVWLSLRLPLKLVAAIAMFLPMQILFVYAGMTYGIADRAEAFSAFVGLFALPWIFLLIYPPFLPYIDGVRLSRYFRWSVLLAAAWGIFLFFWRPFMGHFIEIPYLTVNAADYGQIEATKHIARGFFMKLISTYNNGNLYGVATLILLPLYQVLERVRWRRGVVIAALLFTLARTVWVGLVLAEIIPLAALMLRQVKTFPVVYLGKAAKSIVAVAVTIGLVFVALLFNSSASYSGLAFLFDPTAGGRTNELMTFRYAGLLPDQGLRGFSEIVYSSVVDYYGWAGFFAFCLIMVSPLLLLAVDRTALKSPIRMAALQGLILYALIAWSDGAFLLIPVMAFYWFAYMIYLFGWPNEEATLIAEPARSRKADAPLPSEFPQPA